MARVRNGCRRERNESVQEKQITLDKKKITSSEIEMKIIWV